MSLGALLSELAIVIRIIYFILSILLILEIVKNTKSLSSNLPWIVLILLFPAAGTMLYLFIGNDFHSSKTLKKINKEVENSKQYYVQDPNILKELNDRNLDKLKFLTLDANFPVTKNNKVTYYKTGEEAFEAMAEELKKAKKYIFLEYFRIDNGIFWSTILDILKEKAKEGVEVRMIFDDFGCIQPLPNNFDKQLEEMGIKTVVFNEIKPFLGIVMNNRDHRKFMIIDGETVFSGGINLADEYINKKTRFGYWKDNGIMVKGEGVDNFIIMFISLWNAYRKNEEDYTKYIVKNKKKYKENGYLCAYCDNPLNNEYVGENIYLNIINQSKKYLYIDTPYLILDSELTKALILAAKRGVKVKIVVPNKPDKKTVYVLTSSYFENLINNGIEIYTYTPGFIHSKVFVSDDTVATVGTFNMDYRSLHLHFECGIYMEEVDEIKNIKKDLIETIKESHKVTKEEATPGFFKGIWEGILRLFAPMM
jgi:cardiolipin synthase